MKTELDTEIPAMLRVKFTDAHKRLRAAGWDLMVTHLMLDEGEVGISGALFRGLQLSDTLEARAQGGNKEPDKLFFQGASDALGQWRFDNQSDLGLILTGSDS